MAELPSTKPTEDLDHDTNATNSTETPGGTKTDGYADNAILPAAQYNWLQWAQGKSIEWCRALAVRHFDNLYDAINGTAAEDMFLVSAPKRGRAESAHHNNTAATAVRKIASDGRIVVTVDDQDVRGEPNGYISASIGTTALWLYDASTEGGIDATRISTDGVVVAIANGITGTPPRVVIVTTASDDGGIAYEDADTGYVYAICADSYGGATPRVWWGTHGGAGADKIFRWTGGARTEMLGSLTDVKCMCATADYLIFSSVNATNVSLYAYYKEAFTLAWNAASFVASVGSRSQSVCSDGDLIFHLLDGVGGSAAPSLRAVDLFSGAVIWTVTGGTNYSYAANLRVECDDRHVYAMWRVGSADTITVFDKATGRIVWYHANGSAFTDFCLDGRSLLACTGDSRVYYFPTAAQPGLWVRRDQYDATRQPAKLLALPVGNR